MYEQLKKNTVDARNQIAKSEHIRTYNEDGKGIRVMFAGNSITLHSPKEEIGWFGDYGMAASEREKDYVHLLMHEITKKDADAAYCICHVSEWERNYKNGSEIHGQFACAKAFQADIIIARFVENCSGNEFDIEIFKKEFAKFIEYLSDGGRANVVFTSGFWKHPGDRAIREFAEEKGCPFVELSDLGERDDMKAFGLFWHKGVAEHPGDGGMKAIAERIWKVLRM